MKKLSLHIATGIYPPEVGGPAEYAKNLEELWRNQGHTVGVSVFSRLNYLPTGIRHIVYFLTLLPRIWNVDCVFVLDTFSVAFPAVCASILLRKKVIIRVGGDFLWETYMMRTGDTVLLRDFYTTTRALWSRKEKIIFSITQFSLKHASVIIWSTPWQKEFTVGAYGLEHTHHAVVENYYGTRVPSSPQIDKVFVASARRSPWKNLAVLQKIFNDEPLMSLGFSLDTDHVNHDEFLTKISHSYAVIVASISDISPNTILDAIKCHKPFIVTKETGLYDRIKDIAVFVDPLNKEDIQEKILWLCNEDNYRAQKKKIEEFTFTHEWEDIGNEYLEVYMAL